MPAVDIILALNTLRMVPYIYADFHDLLTCTPCLQEKRLAPFNEEKIIYGHG